MSVVEVVSASGQSLAAPQTKYSPCTTYTSTGSAHFSQWYDFPFKISGITYKTAEHYMMTKKAKLFGDFDTETKIIASNDSGAAKQFGRKVRNFDEKVYVNYRFEIVVEADIEKFSQHTELKSFCLIPETEFW